MINLPLISVRDEQTSCLEDVVLGSLMMSYLVTLLIELSCQIGAIIHGTVRDVPMAETILLALPLSPDLSQSYVCVCTFVRVRVRVSGYCTCRSRG